MKTVFIGGSRHLNRLSGTAQERIGNVVKRRLEVVVGDAPGIDTSAQQYLFDNGHDYVTVFGTAPSARNNVGHWPVELMEAPRSVRGYQRHSVKDREMARRADFGLMIWDGKSPGTMLNVLRLARAGKPVVIIDEFHKRTTTIKSFEQWQSFLSDCDEQLVVALKTRATASEWTQPDPVKLNQPSLQRVESSPERTDIKQGYLGHLIE